jgi:hypothetical protein
MAPGFPEIEGTSSVRGDRVKWVRLVILRFSCFIADFAEPQSEKNHLSAFALAAPRRVNKNTLLDLTFCALLHAYCSLSPAGSEMLAIFQSHGAFFFAGLVLTTTSTRAEKMNEL